MTRNKPWLVVFLTLLCVALTRAEDPNAVGVPWKNLASWRFDNGTFLGNAGQIPLAQSGVTMQLNQGYFGNGVRFPTAGTSSSLKYKGIESNGSANVALLRGSVRLRFKTFWSSQIGRAHV